MAERQPVAAAQWSVDYGSIASVDAGGVVTAGNMKGGLVKLTATLGAKIFAETAVNFGIALWLASFLVRTYGLTEADAGRIQGLLTMTIGVAGVMSGGWVSDWFVRRGKVDGPLRVGMIGAAGMLVAATAYPLMPTARLAIAWLV